MLHIHTAASFPLRSLLHWNCARWSPFSRVVPLNDTYLTPPKSSNFKERKLDGNSFYLFILPSNIFSTLRIRLEKVLVSTRLVSWHIYPRNYIAMPHALNAEHAPVSRTTLHLPSQNFNGLSIVLLLKTPTPL